MRTDSQRLEMVYTALHVGRNVTLGFMILLFIILIAEPIPNIQWVSYVNCMLWGIFATLFLIRLVIGWDYSPKNK